ncbi:uncharacterized protein [Montipora capricornis]|uniref:uncharacterized protein isoform X2 n=1 Tax=Montipora foliosa TaxID=591990 RepID=UPI0035F19A14
MEMTFSASDVVGSVLFKGWRVTNSAGMFGSCIAVILIAVLFETFKSYKVHRQNQRTPQKQDSEATSLLANSHRNHPSSL